MKLVIQQVKSAKVLINNKVYSSINKGLLVFLGIHQKDTAKSIQYLTKKLLKLRVFIDENNKMNLSIVDLNLSIMLVSQITLYADTQKGNRLSFIKAAKTQEAEQLYNLFISELNKYNINLETGKFGAQMEIKLINEGPKTFILES